LHPADQHWMPGEDMVENGLIVYRGLPVAGVDDHL
jgi:hypothetical protein